MTIDPQQPTPGSSARRQLLRLLRKVGPVQRLALAIAQPQIKRERRRAQRRTSWSAPDAIELRSGRLFGSAGASLPILALVVVGIEPDAEHLLAREVEESGFIRGGYRPLVVMDGADFRSFRERNIPVERLLPERDFAAVSPWGDYEAYLARRISGIVASYGAVAAVPIGRFPDGTWGLRRLHVSGEVRPLHKSALDAARADPSPP